MFRRVMPAKLLLFPFLLGLFIGGSSFAQEASLSKREKKELQRKRVAEVVEAKQYKIQVQQAFTMRGRQINLTGAYGMIVTPERIQCDLPYFGQSYGGTSYGGEGGVKLDSKDFTYESISTKKGGWDVSITPKDDTKDVRTVVLNISSDGYISLNFTFNTRSIMRYSGVIVTEEKK